jgi:hypothetical protein
LIASAAFLITDVSESPPPEQLHSGFVQQRLCSQLRVMMDNTPTYLLADQPSELERLQLQSRVWEPAGRALLADVPAGSRARALDVGCGVMGWLRILSLWTGPNGSTVGSDSIRFHDLRHSACTCMLEGGVPLPVVADVLGWSPATTTKMAKLYGHIGDSARRQAMQATRTIEIELESFAFPFDANAKAETTVTN